MRHPNFGLFFMSKDRGIARSFALLFPKLLFAGEIPKTMLLVFVLGGQAALFVYDRAYDYFLIHLWGQVREKLFGRG